MKIKSLTHARKKKSQRLLDEGCNLVYRGFIDEAYEKFDQSYKLDQSADALTYKGWMLNIKGDPEGALKLCHQAIKLDPEFGNPYNDIGTILVAQKILTMLFLGSKKQSKPKGMNLGTSPILISQRFILKWASRTWHWRNTKKH